MNLDRHATVDGVPLKKVRDLLIFMGGFSLTPAGIAERIGRGHVGALVAAGYLQKKATRFRSNRRTYYEAGPNGDRLRCAKFIPRISRERAAPIVAGLLDRAKRVNADPEFLLRVERITAFGSYVQKTPTAIGDIDVVVELRWKLETPAERRAAMDARREELMTAGRRFNGILDSVMFPTIDTLRFLKGRQPYLSFQDEGDLKLARKKVVLFP